jgi:hypothetical protein
MKRYLGDGVYVDFDGFQIVLSTEDGLRTTNTICLEPGVYTALLGYVEMLKKIEEPKAEMLCGCGAPAVTRFGFCEPCSRNGNGGGAELLNEEAEAVMWDSSKPGNEGY